MTVLNLEPLKEYGVSEPFCRKTNKQIEEHGWLKILTQLSLPRSRGVEGGLQRPPRVGVDGKLVNFPGGEKDMGDARAREEGESGRSQFECTNIHVKLSLEVEAGGAVKIDSS